MENPRVSLYLNLALYISWQAINLLARYSHICLNINVDASFLCYRLTPPYMLVMMVFLALYPYLGSGPMWPKEAAKDSCRDTWWYNLLYINNFVTVADEVILHINILNNVIR